jgi:AcrR family transcriptional regulator
MKHDGKATTERKTADERRDAVLEAAIIEFASLGLHGASTEAIAERAGISQPYIFRLFGTKRELFMAAVDRVCDRIIEAFRHAVEAQPKHPLQAMGESFSTLIASRDELVLLLHAFAAAAKDPDALEVARRRLHEMYNFIAQASGASDAEMQKFLAHGMLMTVAASLDLCTLAEAEPWAMNLIAKPH